MDFLSDLVANNSVSTPSDCTEISATDYRLFRSIRAPDFVRLRLYLDANFHCVRSRVDLIVELKKRGIRILMTERLLEKVCRQVEEQAAHAFLQDDDLTAVGFIIRAGNVWRYGELAHANVLTMGNPKPNRDGTYSPSSTGSESSNSATPGHLSSGPATPEPSIRTTINTIGTSPNLFRSLNPSPPSQAQIRLDTTGWPCVLTNFSLPEQIQWLADVKERLDEVDALMAGSYRT
jgi:hypothetical protein